jgi:tetratricopeptide (TPR) repeat protein
MTSQVLRHVSVECTRCSSKYDNALAWRLVSAVERPEDVRRLGDLLMVQCVTCQTPIQHGHPVVVLDWLPYVPILCVLPNGWDFAPAGTEDLEQLLHMAGKSLQDVVWVPQVRADGLSPVAVDRWVSSGAFETPEHEFFRQFLDRWLDARAREVPPAILRWAGETDDQALANFPWMATGFLTRVQDQVRKQVGPSRPDLAPAMTAFVERLGSGGGAPPLEFRTRIQDVVSKTNIPARLKLLLKKASDENLEPAARISVAERGLGLSESTDEDPFVAFFSEALYRVRRMYLPMTSDNLRENVALLRNALAAASRAEITDYALHLQFQLADAIREAATDREQHQECLDLYEDAVSRLPPTIEAARLSLIDSNYALMLMNAYDAGLGSALLFEASRRIDAALAYRMGRGPSIDLVYSLHSRGLITSRLVRHADQTDTPPEVLVARAFSDVDAAVEICRQIGADRPDLLPTILAERLDVNEHFSTDGPMKEAARRRQVDHAAEITTDETLPTNLRGRAWSVLGLLDDDTHGPMATLLERAIEFLDADSDPFLRVRTFTGLGKEAAKSGAWKNAAQNFERAFNLWSTTLDARVAAGLFESSKARQNDPAGRWAGYCYAKAGDLERAVELVEASLCFETGWLQRRRASELRHIEQVMPELARAYRNTLAAAEALQGAQGYGDARKKLESIAEQIRTHGVSNFLSLTRFEEIVQRASETNPIVYVVLTPWGIAHLIVTGRHGDPARLIELKGLTAMDIEELTQGHIGSSGGFTAGMVTSSTTDEWIESTGRTLAVIGPSLIAPLLSALDTSIASAITFVVTGHLQGVPLHAAPLNLRADARCLWDYLDVDYVRVSFGVQRTRVSLATPRELTCSWH